MAQLSVQPLQVQPSLSVQPLAQPSAPLNVQPLAQPQTPLTVQPVQQQPRIVSTGTATSQQPYTPRLSVDEFATKIKAQYPQYQSIDNNTLAQKIIAKYPQYADKVDFGSPAQQQPQFGGGPVLRGIQEGFYQAGQAGIGALKSIPATINNASELGQRALRKITGIQQPIASLPQSIVAPSNPEQQAGFLGGQIGQAFAIPNAAIDSAAGKVANLANAGKLQPLVTGAAKASAQAITGTAAAKLGGATDKQALTAGAVSGALSAAGSLFSSALQKSAQTSYAKALGATTKQNKILSDKVIPGLLEDNQVALSRSTLYNKAAANAEKADAQITSAWEALPANTRTDWQPVLSKLEQEKNALKVNGVVLDSSKYNALHTVQSDLIDVAAGKSTIPAADARAARQILDKAIRKSTQTFGLTGTESDLLAARKVAANAIRSQLASEHPEINVLNKQFNFWKNVQDVVDATIQRTKSQGSLGQDIAGAAGSVIEGGNGLGKILEGNMVGRLLTSAFKSTAWMTTSAVVKANLADYLVSGNVAKATALLQRLTSPAKIPQTK